MAHSRIDARQDGIALRLRVAHLLDSATLDPPGMPPSAILLVRRLADPLPRRLLPDPHAIRPAGEWERAAQAALEQLVRCALRPACGFVPASAASVLFADPGEMLACLARDLLNGNAASLWWWRAILRRLPSGAVAALLAAWGRQPEYIPAALHYLIARNEAIRILGSLSPAEAWSLLREVARVFKLELPTGFPASTVGPRAAACSCAKGEDDTSEFVLTSSSERSVMKRATPPWVPAIAAELAPPSLGRERAALLGISLLLHRAPEHVRAGQFAAAFAAWYAAFTPRAAGAQVPAAESKLNDDIPPAPATVEPRVPPDRITVLPAADELEPPSPESRQQERRGPAPDEVAQSSEPGVTPEPSVSSSPGTNVSLKADATIATAPRASTSSLEVASRSRAGEKTVTLPETARRARAQIEPVAASAPEPEMPTPAAPAPAVTPSEALQTELGGILFLINCLRAHNLPASLESGFGIEPPMNAWMLLLLFARCLLGQRGEHFAADPIWSVLDRLSGHSPDRRLDFQGQERYSLPESWIAISAPISHVGVRLRGRHLQVWHPCGFILLDCNFDTPPPRALVDEEVRSLSGTGAVTPVSWRHLPDKGWTGCCPLDMEVPTELRRFLAFLLPYVRWRLALGLGLEAAPRARLAQELLVHSGRLYVTSTHIDLVMNLEHANSRVRLSGLDCDPGWLPDFGRVVKFSFV